MTRTRSRAQPCAGRAALPLVEEVGRQRSARAGVCAGVRAALGAAPSWERALAPRRRPAPPAPAALRWLPRHV